jgi:hypothetical protein
VKTHLSNSNERTAHAIIDILSTDGDAVGNCAYVLITHHQFSRCIV